MVIYGIQSSLRKTELIADNCPNCNASNSVQMNVFQRYSHIFFIPLFPVGKIGVSQCLHCKQVLQLKEMPDSIKLSYRNIKSRTNVPIWTFSGLVVMILIIGSGIMYDKYKVSNAKKMLSSLKKDDILEVHIHQVGYTLFKVDHVADSMVYVTINKYQTDREDGIGDLKDKEFDNSVVKAFSVPQLRENKDFEILDIDRE